jgi:hypothetical protein
MGSFRERGTALLSERRRLVRRRLVPWLTYILAAREECLDLGVAIVRGGEVGRRLAFIVLVLGGLRVRREEHLHHRRR